MGILYYHCHIIHVNKTRSNWHKRNRITHTHTNSTVVLDGIILDTLHEETTSANSENIWATFLKRFFSGKSFRHPIRKEERRTFHKAFVISDVHIDNRPAAIHTDTLDTREHSTLSNNYNDNFSQRAYIFHPFATFFLGNIFHTHTR
jgi:hypothetical protein